MTRLFCYQDNMTPLGLNQMQRAQIACYVLRMYEHLYKEGNLTSSINELPVLILTE